MALISLYTIKKKKTREKCFKISFLFYLKLKLLLVSWCYSRSPHYDIFGTVNSAFENDTEFLLWVLEIKVRIFCSGLPRYWSAVVVGGVKAGAMDAYILGRIHKNTTVEPGSIHYYEWAVTNRKGRGRSKNWGKRCSEALSKWKQ